MASVERQRLGQWFTPPAVAKLALRLALDGAAPARVLDPTCGDGAFLATAAGLGVAPERLAGVDVDPAAAAAAARRVPGARVDCADLFALDPDDLAADVVVGNPPYVRQELLGDASKQRIRQRLARDFPDVDPGDLDRLVGRGDLAVACIARVLRVLSPRGRAALVVSTALLDAGYAAPLWRLVRRVGRVVAVVEAPRERWFSDAAVNACIVVVERGGDRDAPVVVARLRASTAEAAARVHRVADLGAVADLRHGPADAPARWAALLRAPAVWLEIERRARGQLVALGKLATLRRGITSGANDFFYLSRARAASLSLEPSCLRPLVRSPRERGAATIDVDPERCEHVALCLPADAPLPPGAARYVAASADVVARPTLRARRPWWSLPATPARLFLTKAYAARFVQRLSPTPVVADQRVYAVAPATGVDPVALCAVLNSSFGALALEALGRSSLGEGALEWTVGDAAALPLLDPRGLGPELGRALAPLRRRTIGDVSSEAGRADRAALDRAVAPSLADLLPAVHEALIASTSARATRSKKTRPATT